MRSAPNPKTGKISTEVSTGVKMEVWRSSVLLENEVLAISCNCGISHICRMSRQMIPVIDGSAKKNGPQTLQEETAQTHSL